MYDSEQYEGAEFGYRSVEANSPIAWAQGHSLTKDATIFVPAFAVYQPYLSQRGEAVPFQQVTTGLACGNTLEEAVLSALCEVIERDAAMLCWLRRVSPPKADCSGSAVQRALKRFGRLAESVSLLDATNDLGIPACIAVWHGPINDQPRGVFASCANPDAQKAAVGALNELAQCLMWATSLLDKGKRIPDASSEKLTEIEEHVLWPLDPSARPRWQFLLESRSEGLVRTHTHGDSAFDAIDACVRALARNDMDVVIVDVTAPDIRECGFHVVRAIVPEAQPLFFGTGLHRFSRRALTGSTRTNLNLHPHPFP
jgi:ribosomal protein S12 methylthiotransferase accessory factor